MIDAIYSYPVILVSVYPNSQIVWITLFENQNLLSSSLYSYRCKRPRPCRIVNVHYLPSDTKRRLFIELFSWNSCKRFLLKYNLLETNSKRASKSVPNEKNPSGRLTISKRKNQAENI